MMRRCETSRVLMGKLPKGCDLMEELTTICRAEGVRLGKVEALGAVETAQVGYYDQKLKKYTFFTLDGPREILSLVGNVSLKEGEPTIHAHITLSDAAGAAFGGHLAPGTVVFACEYAITVLKGEDLQRGYDEATGLPLWEDE